MKRAIVMLPVVGAVMLSGNAPAFAQTDVRQDQRVTVAPNAKEHVDVQQNQRVTVGQKVPAIDNGRGPAKGQSVQPTPSAPSPEITFPPPVQVGVPAPPLSKRQNAALKIAGKRINDKLMPTPGPDGSVSYIFGHTIPELVCAPGYWCAVQLEKGEVVIGPDGKPGAAVFIIDSANWWVQLGVRGSRKDIITDVLVSPKYPDTHTSATWGTNKGRRYSVNMRSTKTKHIPVISFTYPDDQVRLANAAYSTAVGAAQGGAQPGGAVEGGVDISALDFGYTIDGDAEFKPVAVYSDGSRTVVEFGKEIDDMPVLVGIADDGTWFTDASRYVLNTRLLSSRKLLVEGTFKKAALVAGVGSGQQEVLIEKQ